MECGISRERPWKSCAIIPLSVLCSETTCNKIKVHWCVSALLYHLKSLNESLHFSFVGGVKRPPREVNIKTQQIFPFSMSFCQRWPPTCEGMDCCGRWCWRETDWCWPAWLEAAGLCSTAGLSTTATSPTGRRGTGQSSRISSGSLCSLSTCWSEVLIFDPISLLHFLGELLCSLITVAWPNSCPLVIEKASKRSVHFCNGAKVKLAVTLAR